jgi:RNA polymerase sigma factor (sigma-70 family)
MPAMEAPALIDKLYKRNFARMVIALTKYTGMQDLSAAEDIVQEAFLEASRKWPVIMPDNPEAWLYRVCRNMAYKHIRDGKTRRMSSVFESENTLKYQIDHLFEDAEEEDQLKMLYSCVHPHFAPKAQVTFALRYVAGFRIEQIALVLGAQEESITKTLLRMRETISREHISFQAGSLKLVAGRTPVVLKIIYLMFNEGYKSSQGKSILNLELCEDALSLTQSIVRSPALVCAEAEGLLALILFSLSRFEARFDAHGEIVDLENQDRTLWNQELITVAKHHLHLATKASYGTWHLEAAIAFLHSNAKTFDETDWKGITSIYDRILETNDSPFTRLNQAVALFYSGDVVRAMKVMNELGESAIMQRYHLYHVAMGKFYHRMKQRAKAIEHLSKAIELTRHEVEKSFIRKLM